MKSVGYIWNNIFEAPYSFILIKDEEIVHDIKRKSQIPFVTITLGLGTTKWERMVSKCILKTRIEGLGKGKITAVFPKISFLHRNEINGSIGSPNYDIKKLAIKCSAKRMYPDWLSLDSGYLKEVYDRSGKAISGMGL